MKKHFLTGTIFALIFLIAGCDLGGTSFNPDAYLEKQTITIEKDTKYLYLGKVNFDYLSYTGPKTGYVKDGYETPEPEEDPEEGLNGGINGNVNGDMGFIFNEIKTRYNDTTAIDAFNKEILEKNKYNLAREISTGVQLRQNNAQKGQKKTFYVGTEIVNNKMKQTPQEAVCKATNDVCNVWYVSSDKDFIENNLSDSSFNTIANKVKQFISLEEELCGSHIYDTKSKTVYINPVDKIDIIVFDIFSDAWYTNDDRQKGGTFGYFSSNDMYDNNQSNKTQCIYIDSYFYTQAPAMVFSTLVHEYNHLLNFVQKTIIHGNDNYSTWFTEMLSMVTEDLFQSLIGLTDEESPKGRAPYFCQYANYGFGRWLSGNSILGQNGDDVYISYANAYIYGAYLGRNFGGPELIHKIATNEFVDEEAITEALHAMGYTEANGNEQDFKSTLEDECIIMFNIYPTEITQNNSFNTYTLYNKSPIVWEKSDQIKFVGFNINYVYTSGYSQYTLLEQFYKQSAWSPYKQRPLYPYGFDVTMIKDIDTEANKYTIDIMRNPNVNMQYFVFWTSK